MSPESFVEIMRDAMFIIILIVSAIILPGLLIGLVVAVFQAATSINEQTMSFLPRLVITLLALSWLGSWLTTKMMDYTNDLVLSIPSVIG
ncbi:flagellar biosynthesis protein FliQ [Glaciecola sp. XM2]|jgi:flagellar biosynthetic protein FliQ|uniref:flagellar biosynthesis protein FliQ n=1 Tax=Glaciecola sp. XM2 TaxID=1914931 RepID=UPI001BDF4A5F|nr:flagellar biosynthesis protein FliQ [Glaciecola sp. XM2]MBT1450831.1 flagellar biosynthesis protein FliQ [Glaciecola sp. XM2]